MATYYANKADITINIYNHLVTKCIDYYNSKKTNGVKFQTEIDSLDPNDFGTKAINELLELSNQNQAE